MGNEEVNLKSDKAFKNNEKRDKTCMIIMRPIVKVIECFEKPRLIADVKSPIKQN